ncbi:MAG: cytochrome c3 family protein [Gammaproteobacteria bacterium]|nr:cytochrome c3 family protein [Gammaproteobacteria bacterium]
MSTRPKTPGIGEKLVFFSLLLAGLSWATFAFSQAIVGDPVLGADDPILGSKHDFTGLNDRAGVVAMAGVAFSDYGYSCVYCHIPPEEVGADPQDFGGIDGWNRYVPALSNYQLYDSATLDNKTSGPNPISMLCLSCHDGTMAIDMVVFRPATFDPAEDNAMHMRISPDDNIESCGKCHNGQIAHDISVKMLGTDLRNDHPISMQYAGLNFRDVDFRPPDTSNGFDNGVKLYNGKVECMTCHNVHDPSRELLLRANAEVLCFTCHIK